MPRRSARLRSSQTPEVSELATVTIGTPTGTQGVATVGFIDSED